MVKKLYSENDTLRLIPEGDKYDHRSPWRRDYTRLVHSAAFRRLQRKTQLFPGETDFFRNRLTHSLEVAQVAKSIGQRINSINLLPYTESKISNLSWSNISDYTISLDLLEFASLAHDIGHPPFGHNGEHALNEAMALHGGFEGNGQTLRIVTKLIPKVELGGISAGINPTYRSIASILKYDNLIQSRSVGAKLQKGYYRSELDLVEAVKSNILDDADLRDVLKLENFWTLKGGTAVKLDDHQVSNILNDALSGFKTIECQIMDLADDIAYCCYDLDDAMKAGFTSPLDIRAKKFEESFLSAFVIDHFSKIDSSFIGVTHENATGEMRDKIKKYSLQVAEDLEFLYSKLMPDTKLAQQKNITEEQLERHILQTYRYSEKVSSNGYIRNAVISNLVSYFIDQVEFVYNSERPALSIATFPTRVRQQIEVLKNFTYRVQIMSARLKTVEYRGKKIVSDLFVALKSNRGRYLLPKDWQAEYNECSCEHAKARVICDYIAGMSDRHATEFYEKLFSPDSGSIFR